MVCFAFLAFFVIASAQPRPSNDGGKIYTLEDPHPHARFNEETIAKLRCDVCEAYCDGFVMAVEKLPHDSSWAQYAHHADTHVKRMYDWDEPALTMRKRTVANDRDDQMMIEMELLMHSDEWSELNLQALVPVTRLTTPPSLSAPFCRRKMCFERVKACNHIRAEDSALDEEDLLHDELSDPFDEFWVAGQKKILKRHNVEL